MCCSLLIYGCLTWSFCCDQLVLPSIALMSRLEFCGCDLDMSLHYCQGVATSGPLILVHLSCCDLIQPAVSVLVGHLCSFYFNILFLFNFLLHRSLLSYSTFLHINQSFFFFFIEINQKNGLKIDDFSPHELDLEYIFGAWRRETPRGYLTCWAVTLAGTQLCPPSRVSRRV